jgi:hypothetical protein
MCFPLQGTCPPPAGPTQPRSGSLACSPSRVLAVRSTPHKELVTYDNEIPEFLLPFIAEHVRSVEQAAGQEDGEGAATESSATVNAAVLTSSPRWQKVPMRQALPDARKAVREEDAMTLYSARLRYGHRG